MNSGNYNNFYYNCNAKKKPGLSKQQTDILARIYAVNTKPTTLQRIEIARNLNVPEDKVKNWFQNKRAKDKKMKNEMEEEESFRNFDGRYFNDLSFEIFPSCNDLYRKKPKHS